jgi:hypothetical protein
VIADPQEIRFILLVHAIPFIHAEFLFTLFQH